MASSARPSEGKRGANGRFNFSYFQCRSRAGEKMGSKILFLDFFIFSFIGYCPGSTVALFMSVISAYAGA